jgi:hypothetical protein
VALAEVVAGHYAQRVSLARATVRAVAALWRRTDPDRISGSWSGLARAAELLLFGAQREAAAAADEYVVGVLAEQGVATTQVGIQPESFAGAASDGRDLRTLLYQPAITTLVAIRAGASTSRALTSGEAALRMIAGTQVADAGRAADQVALVAQPRVTGFVRMLNPPSCSRCAILAGRRYEWKAEFLRHPLCDCIAVPAAEDAADDLRTDSKAYFASLSAAEQNRIFTKAGAEAIRDGADIARVVNARRGMYTAAGRQLTTEAAGRRARPMPEQIYAEAGDDRAEAVRLLQRFGYLR